MTQIRRRWQGYALAVLAVALCTGIASLMSRSFSAENLIMLYLVDVMLVALRFGSGPSLLAASLSVAAYDFFFVPPFFTLAVADTQHVPTFAVMFLVAAVIGALTARIREQAAAARERGLRTAALYALSRELAGIRTREEIAAAVVRQVAEVFDCRAALQLPGLSGAAASASSDGTFRMEAGAAGWVLAHGECAGLGTDRLPGARGLYLPLVSAHATAGVLGLQPRHPERLQAPEQMHLLETFANQAASALERVRLADEAQQARVQAESEHLRNALLSAISHDLRTPLASITGSISSLLDEGVALDEATRHELLTTAYEEADRLNRLVRNLLDMTRLESGAVTVRKEWQPLEEVAGAALTHLEGQLRDRPVTTRLPATLPLVALDSAMIEQVLANLLENALKYTPPGSPIELAAVARAQEVAVTVADRGPGVPPGSEERIFDKFYRGRPEGAQPGAGLGLAICRAIVTAHGGRIWAVNRPEGGAAFTFTLPAGAEPPAVEAEAPVAGEREPG